MVHLPLVQPWPEGQSSSAAHSDFASATAHLPCLHFLPSPQPVSPVHSGLGTHLLASHTKPSLQLALVAHSWH